jgi:O-acetylhomoserine/O-acetylserine sulfhydrylase-like pyridoxal-dependent enzyme
VNLPFKNLGADLVVTSATKYIDGQGRGLGGAVIERPIHAAAESVRAAVSI